MAVVSSEAFKEGNKAASAVVVIRLDEEEIQNPPLVIDLSQEATNDTFPRKRRRRMRSVECISLVEDDVHRDVECLDATGCRPNYVVDLISTSPESAINTSRNKSSSCGGRLRMNRREANLIDAERRRESLLRQKSLEERRYSCAICLDQVLKFFLPICPLLLVLMEP